jgi:hypothetical protein
MQRAMTPDSLAKGLGVNATQAEEVLCGASSCKCGLGVCFENEEGNKVHSWPGVCSWLSKVSLQDAAPAQQFK